MFETITQPFKEARTMTQVISFGKNASHKHYNLILQFFAVSCTKTTEQKLHQQQNTTGYSLPGFWAYWQYIYLYIYIFRQIDRQVFRYRQIDRYIDIDGCRQIQIDLDKQIDRYIDRQFFPVLVDPPACQKWIRHLGIPEQHLFPDASRD